MKSYDINESDRQSSNDQDVDKNSPLNQQVALREKVARVHYEHMPYTAYYGVDSSRPIPWEMLPSYERESRLADAGITIAATIQGLLELPLPEEASQAAEDAENRSVSLTPRGMHEAEFRAMLTVLQSMIAKEAK